MTETTPQPIGADSFYLPGSASLITFSDTTPSVTKRPGNGGKEMKISYGNTSTSIWSWGSNNLLPQEREALVLDNNIVPELMATKRDITVGGGLMYYTERFENGKRIIEEEDWPAAARQFAEELPEKNGGQDLDAYFLKACRNAIFHSNTFTEAVRSLGSKVDSIEALECRHVRPEKMSKNGVIQNYFWSGNWKEYKKPDFTPVKIPAYVGEMKNQSKFIIHCMDDLLSDDYLGIPTWWGGRAWIECANAIPIFHINNLRNGYTIRWHIEIPKDYFWDYTSAQSTQPEKAAAKAKESEARKEFLKKLDAFLAGYEQAGRAIITDYELNKAAGKDFPGIKITPLNVDLKDKALLDLFEKSNDANISGQGVHPTLAAIQTQGKLSSGSEIRNAFAMYVAIKTPVKRSLLLKPWNYIHRVNGWGKGGKWGFRDIEITKLDENPTGKQEVAVGA
ncbi:MAG TPA: hypothetical protein PK228_01415 [Saprospiraceae bacterium]|nr:hypothetical protein [Saprospiraceae bacterium]